MSVRYRNSVKNTAWGWTTFFQKSDVTSLNWTTQPRMIMKVQQNTGQVSCRTISRKPSSTRPSNQVRRARNCSVRLKSSMKVTSCLRAEICIKEMKSWGSLAWWTNIQMKRRVTTRKWRSITPLNWVNPMHRARNCCSRRLRQNHRPVTDWKLLRVWANSLSKRWCNSSLHNFNLRRRTTQLQDLKTYSNVTIPCPKWNKAGVPKCPERSTASNTTKSSQAFSTSCPKSASKRQETIIKAQCRNSNRRTRQTEEAITIGRRTTRLGIISSSSIWRIVVIVRIWMGLVGARAVLLLPKLTRWEGASRGNRKCWSISCRTWARVTRSCSWGLTKRAIQSS